MSMNRKRSNGLSGLSKFKIVKIRSGKKKNKKEKDNNKNIRRELKMEVKSRMNNNNQDQKKSLKDHALIDINHKSITAHS